MNKQSNTYTIIYIIILVVVVGTALAATSLALRERQQDNVNADKMSQILNAALISPDKKDVVAEFDKYITDQFVVNERGETVEGVKAFDVNVAAQSKVAADRRELPVLSVRRPTALSSISCLSTVRVFGGRSGAMSPLTVTARPSMAHILPIRARLPVLALKSRSLLSAVSSRERRCLRMAVSVQSQW